MVYLTRENDSGFLGSILDGRLTKLADADPSLNGLSLSLNGLKHRNLRMYVFTP